MAKKSKAYVRNGWVILSRRGATDLGEIPGTRIGKVSGSRCSWEVHDVRGKRIGRNRRQRDAIRLLFNHVKRKKVAAEMQRRFGGRRRWSLSALEIKHLLSKTKLPAGEMEATFAVVALLKKYGCTEIKADNGVGGELPPNRKVPGLGQFRRADIEAVTTDGNTVYIEVKTVTGMGRDYSGPQLADQELICLKEGWLHILVVVEAR